MRINQHVTASNIADPIQEMGETVSETNPTPTVFVVDDDPSMRKSLGRLLRSAGFAEESFGSAEEFLNSYDPQRPGCLILDVCMEEMTGLQLQAKLNEQGIFLPIIVISGFGEVENVVTAVKGGAIDFLEKPFDDDLLMTRVRQALEVDQHRRVEAERAEHIKSLINTLTPREKQVMELLVQGRRTKQIAYDLHISPKTADIHRAHVLEKMQADTVVDLVRLVHDLSD